MAESGFTVYVNGFDKKVLAARYKNLIDLGYDAKPAFFDATNIEAINRFLDYIETPIDIFVNNAAIRLRKPLNEISPKAFSEVFEANLTSIYAISRSFAARLEDQQTNGSLINITSIAGPRARPGDPHILLQKAGWRP